MKTKCCIETIKEIEEWLKEKTYRKHLGDGKIINMVRIMPFEWTDFKKELISR